MKRGEIWYVDLGEPPGSAPGFRRPVVIDHERVGVLSRRQLKELDSGLTLALGLA